MVANIGVCATKKTIMKQMTEQEKKYVDELRDEYDRLGEIRGNRIAVGCLVTFVLVLFLLTLNFGLIIIK